VSVTVPLAGAGERVAGDDAAAGVTVYGAWAPGGPPPPGASPTDALLAALGAGDGGVLLDVGAGVGAASIAAASRGVRVVAAEAGPVLAAALTPATKAAGGVTWFTAGGSPNASANEVYNDIVAMVTQLVAQTNGALNIKSPMTLAMSPQSEIAMTFANSFGVYVEALLKKGYPAMKVKTAPQYGQQTTTNPQGYSTAGNFVQLIADKLQGQTVAYCAYNEKLRAHKIVPKLSSWEQKETSGTWGSVIRTPAGIASMLGV
jgi:hypothetical protein